MAEGQPTSQFLTQGALVRQDGRRSESELSNGKTTTILRKSCNWNGKGSQRKRKARGYGRIKDPEKMTVAETDMPKSTQLRGINGPKKSLESQAGICPDGIRSR